MEKEILRIRKAISDRGEYLYYIYRQMKKEGIDDYKGLLSRAVKEWGKSRSAQPPLDQPCGFIKKLESGNLPGVYEREVVSSSEKEGLVRIGYCPLFNAWRNLGLAEDEIIDLCDIACEGDYAVVGNKLKLTFDQRLADGSDYCLMRIELKD